MATRLLLRSSLRLALSNQLRRPILSAQVPKRIVERHVHSGRHFSSITTTGENAPAKTSSDGVVGLPIDFDVASRIEGKESQVREGVMFD